MTEPVKSVRNAPCLNRKQLAVIFCLALGLLIVVAMFVWNESRREARARDMVTHTLLVLKQAIELENVALRMETSQRGFLISGQADMLASRNANHDLAVRMADTLATLVHDNPAQHQHIEQIRIDIEKRFAIMQQNSRIAGDLGLTEARTRFQAYGDGSIEPMRKILAEVRLGENRLLALRLKAYDERLMQFRWLLVIGSSLAFLILIASGVALIRQLVYTEHVAEQLAQSSEQLKFAYEISRIGNWQLNINTGQTKRSLLHDQVFGYEDALPTWSYEMFKQCVHPDDMARVDAAFNKSMQELSDLDFECRIFWPDKTLHWISVHGSIFESADGDRTHMIGNVADITTRKEAELAISSLNRELTERGIELQASNRELESFSYSVSHDLRAPLRHIDGYARMLLEDAGDQLQPESQRYLQTIIGSARRMGMLIDDLLTFSRLGRKPLDKQDVDMQELVSSILHDMASTQAADVEKIHVEPLPGVAGDAALLRQVWINLISNAVKYSAMRGVDARINIAAERKADYVHYQVKDNGVGFDMRYADKLFGVFQRMHPQDQFEGTGVGLAIVQRIIHRHGGSISAMAEKEKGACFTFQLPISEAASE